MSLTECEIVQCTPNQHKMKPGSPALCVEQFQVPHQTLRSLDFLGGTPESPQEHRHESRRTLMSPQEHEIALCTQNQLKMKTNFTALAPEQSCLPHHTQQVA